MSFVGVTTLTLSNILGAIVSVESPVEVSVVVVLSVVVLSVVVLSEVVEVVEEPPPPSLLLLQEIVVRLKRNMEKIMSICLTWFPISVLGEPELYHHLV